MGATSTCVDVRAVCAQRQRRLAGHNVNGCNYSTGRCRYALLPQLKCNRVAHGRMGVWCPGVDKVQLYECDTCELEWFWHLQ